MQAVKKYLSWIIIGVIILGSLAFYYIHVGGLRDKALADHNQIALQVQAFDNFSAKMPTEVPTPKDLMIGGDFLKSILEEGKRARALWRPYSAALEEGILKGTVVYPVTDKQRVGTPVTAQFFPDFLRSSYLEVMASAQNILAKNMQAPWEKMLAQSIYATDYTLNMDQASEQAKTRALAVTREESHIFSPESLIPFKMTDSFTEAEKRVESWRTFLIFRDILLRAVINSTAEVKREVLAFDRPGPDFDENIDTLKTELLHGKGARFIEQLSLLNIEKIKTGQGEILMDKVVPKAQPENADAGGFDPSSLVGAADASEPAAAVDDSNNLFDVYEITIELTAHLKVLHDFMGRISDSDKLYYVSRSCEIDRLPDSVTMGMYSIPAGDGTAAKVIADAAFASSKATPVNPLLGLEHESPVKARLVYLLYRPRFSGMTNFKPAAAASPAGMGLPGM